MGKSNKIKCPNCKGKGHVFNGIMVLVPLMWLVAPFERNNSSGFTREKCDHCKGTGFINY